MADKEREARLLGLIDELVRELQPGQRITVTVDSRFERDLGLDSLARMELLLRVSDAFGLRLPDAAIQDLDTPRALLGVLDQAGGRALAPAVLPTAAAPVPAAPAVVPLPDHAATLVEVLEWHAAHHPERTHVLLYEDGGPEGAPRALTYGELLERARRMAAGLAGRGVSAQQTVALMLPTGADYLCAFFAILLLGAIPVPIYPPVRLSQLEEHLRRHSRILANAGCRVLITVAQAKAVAELLRRDVPELRDVASATDLEQAPTDLRYRAAPEDIAFLQYTSGSTGDPKGVVLTHANLLANIRALQQATEAGPQDVFVSWLPLYHDMGLIGAWLGSLYCAATLVLMSPLAFLARPVRWLQAIHTHRASMTAAPNFAWELAAGKIRSEDSAGLDLSSLRWGFNGAEPVQVSTLEAFCARYAGNGLRREALAPVYGLAECSVGLAVPPPGRGPRIDCIDRERFTAEGRALPASGDQALRLPVCGLPLPGHQIRIVDAQGATLPQRHIGRVWFRGPSATSGYFRNPQASAHLLQGRGADQWLDSGDFGYLAEGEIVLTGRAKDMIIRGGRNLYPYEVEQAVGAVPGVRRGCVAVFAARDALHGTEKLVVMAETRLTQSDALDALRQRVRALSAEVLGGAPDDIQLVAPYSVLKTSSGKIRRAACRERYESGLPAVPPPAPWRYRLRVGAAVLAATLLHGARQLRWRLAGLRLWAALLVLMPLCLPTLWLCASPAGARRLARPFARLACWLGGLKLAGRHLERVPARAHILVVNHASYLDGLVLLALLPARHRHVFVAKRALQDSRLAGPLLRRLGTLFVDRDDAGQAAGGLDAMARCLQTGDSLILFPEGTFTPQTGLRPFRLGAFVLAARTGTPLLAAGLRGTREALRDGHWWPQPGPVALTLGSLTVPSGDTWHDALALRDALRSEMLTLCGEPDLGGPPRTDG